MRLFLKLQFLKELASRARDVDSAGNAAFTVLYALDDACGLAAFGAIRALGRVHDLLAVGCLCDLCAYGHDGYLLISSVIAQPNPLDSRLDDCGWECFRLAKPSLKTAQLSLDSLLPLLFYSKVLPVVLEVTDGAT
jgi:hypothetical protein